MLTTAALCVACGGTRAQTHRTTYPSGSPQWQARLVNGVPEGPTITWHSNGQMASRGTYHRGLRHGEFEFWDDTGVPLRRERYAAGQFVAAFHPTTGAQVARPGIRRTASPEGHSATSVSDHYSELTFSSGFGATNAAREVAGSMDESQGRPTFALGLSLLIRRGHLVVGASGRHATGLWAESHDYVGGVVGGALSSGRAHLQLLSEAGIHVVSGLGTDLFTTASAHKEVELPYVATTLRLSLDPGQQNHFVFDVTATGRLDLGTAQREVSAETCLFGCSTTTEVWQVGGRAAEVTLGVGYRFD